MIETTELTSQLPITVAPAKFLNQIERVGRNHPRWDYITKGIADGYSEIKVVYRVNTLNLSNFPVDKMAWLVKVQEDNMLPHASLFLILPPDELNNKMLLTGLPPQLFVNY